MHPEKIKKSACAFSLAWILLDRTCAGIFFTIGKFFKSFLLFSKLLNPNLKSFSEVLRFFAIITDNVCEMNEFCCRLSFFTKSPVLICTGQSVAHMPSTEQVSKPSYW